MPRTNQQEDGFSRGACGNSTRTGLPVVEIGRPPVLGPPAVKLQAAVAPKVDSQVFEAIRRIGQREPETSEGPLFQTFECVTNALAGADLCRKVEHRYDRLVSHLDPGLSRTAAVSGRETDASHDPFSGLQDSGRLRLPAGSSKER